jgi:hypothetical protein
MIVICGGAGALIDFALGKAGQKRVRGVLEAWWIKVSYANLASFGRAEAGAAGLMLVGLFGHFWRLRRLVLVLGTATLVALAWLLLPKTGTTPGGLFIIIFGVKTALELSTMSLSLSISIWFCRKAEQLLPQRMAYGLLALAAVLALQYVAIEFVRSVIDCFISPLAQVIAQHPIYVMGSKLEFLWQSVQFMVLAYAQSVLELFKHIELHLPTWSSPPPFERRRWVSLIYSHNYFVHNSHLTFGPCPNLYTVLRAETNGTSMDGHRFANPGTRKTNIYGHWWRFGWNCQGNTRALLQELTSLVGTTLASASVGE